MYLEVRLRSGEGWTPEMDVRIANPPPALLAKYTSKEKTFYYEYANFVVRLIQNQTVTDRIHLVISTERIATDRPVDIRVMVFPARTFRGRQNRILHGSYSQSASQISLYPLRMPKQWIRSEGAELFRADLRSLSQRKLRLLYEMSEAAVSTMIHEILHVKFGQRGMNRYGEESLVRKLEGQFMQESQDWMIKPIQQSLPLTSQALT